MKRFAKIFPWIVIALGAAFFIGRMIPASSEGPMNVHAFGEIPIVDGGRVKPYSTLARNNLQIISDREAWEDASGRRQPAIIWLLDVIAKPRQAAQHRVFRVDNLQVLDLLGLEQRPGFRYSYAEINTDENFPKIIEQARRAGQKEGPQRSAFERKVLELWNQLNIYRGLQVSHEVPDLTALVSGDRSTLAQVLQRYRQAKEMEIPLAAPPRSESDEWSPLMEAALKSQAEVLQARMQGEEAKTLGEVAPAVASLSNIFVSYARDDAASFNEAVAGYRQRLASTMPANTTKTGFESWFRHFAPFYSSAVLYVVVALLVCLAWLGWSKPLNNAAFGLATLAFVVHTAALGARMWLDGRPPVTNLYSSAIFVGWGCVGLGLVLDFFARKIFRAGVGIGTLVAAITGFLSLLIAINLAADGSDVLGVQQAVLDTNFWLATHVTTVTFGYVATFVAGFLGIVFVLMGLFTRALNKQMFQTLGRMIYGVLCFALLLSFVGTVLGGIWADQSWGRFWGWDPKENGALVIVLWNALILHARWGGMAQQRGVAVMAIFGNIVTTWSWFGVNELGAGLHSYGFTEGTRLWIMIAVLTNLFFIALGSLPLHWWRSFSDKGKPLPAPRPERGPGGMPQGAPAR